jgi:hypothetical protein
LLRLAEEKHVRIALQNEAETLNPTMPSIVYCFVFVTKSIKLETPKVQTPFVTSQRSAVLFCMSL